MPSGDQNLLAQIERDALDDSTSLAATLRKCITLGAQTRNADLRDWASQELEGYRDDSSIPDYRIIHVPLSVDVASFGGFMRGQQISALQLPEFARDIISEELPLAQGVGAIQALVKNARSSGKSAVKMSPPGASELIVLWNHERQGSGQTIMALYWDVSVALLDGALDKIRTTLVRLVSEMRAAMPDNSSTPSSEQVEQAVSVVLRGGKRNQVMIMSPKADAGSTASVTVGGEQEESGWTKTQTIWTVVGVIVAVVALYFAYLGLKLA